MFQRFVHASSSMVYGDFKKLKVSEDHLQILKKFMEQPNWLVK